MNHTNHNPEAIGILTDSAPSPGYVLINATIEQALQLSLLKEAGVLDAVLAEAVYDLGAPAPMPQSVRDGIADVLDTLDRAIAVGGAR